MKPATKSTDLCPLYDFHADELSDRGSRFLMTSDRKFLLVFSMTHPLPSIISRSYSLKTLTTTSGVYWGFRVQERRGIVISSETASRRVRFRGCFAKCRLLSDSGLIHYRGGVRLPADGSVSRGGVSRWWHWGIVFHRSFESILINSTEPCVARYRFTDAST